MIPSNNGITSNPPLSDGITAADIMRKSGILPRDDSLRSIELFASPGRWECVGLWCLVLAPPIALTACFLFRTGRNLTLPFLFVQMLVFVASAILIVNGWRRRNYLHKGIGVVGILLAFGIGSLCIFEMMGVVVKEYTFVVRVIDESTGQAIPNVKVTFSEPENPHHVKTAMTDPIGRCTIDFCFMGGSNESLVCRTGAVWIGRTSVETEVEGYAATKTRLGLLLADTWSIHDPPPPSLEIRLIPKK